MIRSKKTPGQSKISAGQNFDRGRRSTYSTYASLEPYACPPRLKKNVTNCLHYVCKIQCHMTLSFVLSKALNLPYNSIAAIERNITLLVMQFHQCSWLHIYTFVKNYLFNFDIVI